MDQQQAGHALTLCFFACAGIETWLEMKAGHFPPRPVRFSGLVVVYALLSGLTHLSAGLGAILGLGMLIALIVKTPTISAGSAPSGGGGNAPAAPGGGGTATATAASVTI